MLCKSAINIGCKFPRKEERENQIDTIFSLISASLVISTRKRRRKKRIRRIIDDAELAEETKSSMAQEKVLFQYNL